MNYLAPIRLVLVPFYLIHPDPRTLLLIQNLVFWWVIPAAYTLVRAESKSETIAVSAAALVPFTPLLWPLVWNDFRELQLAIPFVCGPSGRSRPASRAGRAGDRRHARLPAGVRRDGGDVRVPACPRAGGPQPDAEVAAGALHARAGLAPLRLLRLPEIHGRARCARPVHRPVPRPAGDALQTLETSADFLVYGHGGLGPLRLPGSARGDPGGALDLEPLQRPLGLRFLATDGVAPRPLRRAAGRHGPGRGGDRLCAAGTSGCKPAGAAGSCSPPSGSRPRSAPPLGVRELSARMDRIPLPISREEAEAFWYWIRQVGPDDGVLAAYEVTAPLSSRKRLFSYILDQNKPRGVSHPRARNSSGSSSGTRISTSGSSSTRASISCTKVIL